MPQKVGGGVTYALEASENTTTITTKYERDDNLDFGKEEITETNETTDKGTIIHRVIKKGTKPTKEVTKQPFNVRYEENTNLDYGVRNETEGQEGTTTITTTYILNPDGTVIPQKGSPVVVDPVDKVITVGTKAVEYEEEVPYKTVYIEDLSLKLGERKEETHYYTGVNGIRLMRKAYILNRETGQVIEDEPREVQPIKLPIVKDVYIGTKPQDFTEEISFGGMEYTENPEKDLGHQEIVRERGKTISYYGTEYIVNPKTGEVEKGEYKNLNNSSSPSNGITEVGTRPTVKIIEENGKQFKITTYYKLSSSTSSEPIIYKISKEELNKDNNVIPNEDVTLTVNFLEDGTNNKIQESVVLNDVKKNDEVFLEAYKLTPDIYKTILKNENETVKEYNLLEEKSVLDSNKIVLNQKENVINYYYKNNKKTIKYVIAVRDYLEDNNQYFEGRRIMKDDKEYVVLNSYSIELSADKTYNPKTIMKENSLFKTYGNDNTYYLSLLEDNYDNPEIVNNIDKNNEIDEYTKDILKNKKILSYNISKMWNEEWWRQLTEEDKRDARMNEWYSRVATVIDSIDGDFDNNITLNEDKTITFYLTTSLAYGGRLRFPRKIEPLVELAKSEYNEVLGVNGISEDGELLPSPVYERSNLEVVIIKNKNNEVIDVFDASDKNVTDKIKAKYGDGVLKEDENGEKVYIVEKDIEPSNTHKYIVTSIDENGKRISPPKVEIPEYTGTLATNTPVDNNGNLILPPTYNKEEYTKQISTNTPIGSDGNLILPPVVDLQEYKVDIVNDSQKDNEEKVKQSVIDKPKNFDIVYNKQDVKKSDSDNYTNKVEKNPENEKVVQKQNLPKTNALNSTTYILGLLLSTIGFKRNKQE